MQQVKVQQLLVGSQYAFGPELCGNTTLHTTTQPKAQTSVHGTDKNHISGTVPSQTCLKASQNVLKEVLVPRQHVPDYLQEVSFGNLRLGHCRPCIRLLSVEIGLTVEAFLSQTFQFFLKLERFFKAVFFPHIMQEPFTRITAKQ